MTNSVVLNGNTYTDDSDPSTGMGNGGHITRFIPCLSDALVELGGMVDEAEQQANDAETSATAAANSATAAAASESQAELAAGAAEASAEAAAVTATALLSNPDTSGTSTSNVLVGSGTKVFVSQSGKDWAPGMVLTATAIGAGGAIEAKMTGVCSAYAGTSVSLVSEEQFLVGSGTFGASSSSTWTIAVATPFELAKPLALYFARKFTRYS